MPILMRAGAQVCPLPRVSVQDDFIDFDVPFGTPLPATLGEHLHIDNEDGTAYEVEILNVIPGSFPMPGAHHERTKVVASLLGVVSFPIESRSGF